MPDDGRILTSELIKIVGEQLHSAHTSPKIENCPKMAGAMKSVLHRQAHPPSNTTLISHFTPFTANHALRLLLQRRNNPYRRQQAHLPERMPLLHLL